MRDLVSRLLRDPDRPHATTRKSASSPAPTATAATDRSARRAR
jgi:hypothetical protein